MMADPDKPEELSADEVLVELQAAGITTLPSLQAMIANARAREHENRQQWPLLGLIPAHVNAEVARRAADQGLLVAERLGGRWFATVSDVETWLKRTGRWFTNVEDEQRWRKMLVNRKVQ